MFKRPYATLLADRLAEPRRFLQIVAGARQVGKTTLARQVAEASSLPFLYSSADEPTLRSREWVEAQWNEARLLVRDHGNALLILDEIQKIPDWSEAVKRLWDEDTTSRRRLLVVILGSAPLLLQRGLSESLAGRFETLHLPHWSFSEMKQAFDWDLDRYLFFGGYPGAAPLVEDPERWARYIRDSLIETTLSRDVLLLARVDKPALLRRLFQLGCTYSGQVLSYTKMLGQLQESGNVTTLAHYLELLGGSGMVLGLQKFSGDAARRRGSSPKLQVFNTALMTAQAGYSFEETRQEAGFRGRLVESAIGAHLINAAATGECGVFYWRSGNHEVDFVVRRGRFLTAIEVKSGRVRGTLPGLQAFSDLYKPDRKLVVGSPSLSLETFLSEPVEHWTSK